MQIPHFIGLRHSYVKKTEAQAQFGMHHPFGDLGILAAAKSLRVTQMMAFKSWVGGFKSPSPRPAW